MATTATSPPATVVAPKPRFGGGGEKCKQCLKTVYPLERVSYDAGVWHINCFKCLSCASTITLAQVAMIQGDLYCKTCFKRTFLKEGKYSTFEAQKGGKAKVEDDASAAASAASSSSSSSSSSAAASSPSSPPLSTSPPSQSASSTLTSPLNTTASLSKELPITSHSPAPSSSPAPPSETSPLIAAIEAHDVQQIAAALDAHGLTALFTPYKSWNTTLEYAMSYHKSVASKLVELLKQRVIALEELKAAN